MDSETKVILDDPKNATDSQLFQLITNCHQIKPTLINVSNDDFDKVKVELQARKYLRHAWILNYFRLAKIGMTTIDMLRLAGGSGGGIYFKKHPNEDNFLILMEIWPFVGSDVRENEFMIQEYRFIDPQEFQKIDAGSFTRIGRDIFENLTVEPDIYRSTANRFEYRKHILIHNRRLCNVIDPDGSTDFDQLYMQVSGIAPYCEPPSKEIFNIVFRQK